MALSRAYSRDIQKPETVLRKERTNRLFVEKLQENISSGSEIVAKKNFMYGDAINLGGDILAILFPNGVSLRSSEDFKEFAIVNGIIAKFCRMTNIWGRKLEGEKDFTEFESLDDTLIDLGNYSYILETLINIREEKETK